MLAAWLCEAADGPAASRHHLLSGRRRPRRLAAPPPKHTGRSQARSVPRWARHNPECLGVPLAACRHPLFKDGGVLSGLSQQPGTPPTYLCQLAPLVPDFVGRVAVPAPPGDTGAPVASADPQLAPLASGFAGQERVHGCHSRRARYGPRLRRGLIIIIICAPPAIVPWGPGCAGKGTPRRNHMLHNAGTDFVGSLHLCNAASQAKACQALACAPPPELSRYSADDEDDPIVASVEETSC